MLKIFDKMFWYKGIYDYWNSKLNMVEVEICDRVLLILL